ncbi:MAG: hypothetical protein HC927_09025 [Deltaproteobacteria bacterium]|nr:hypothetical protein [Deltaproteobacteria bacterium]
MTPIAAAILAAQLTGTPAEPRCEPKYELYQSIRPLGGANYRVAPDHWYGSGQLQIGLPFLCPSWKVAALLWPSLGAGFDTSRGGFAKGYALATMGVAFGDWYGLIGYHVGGVIGEHRRDVMGGFHHALELRAPLLFLGAQVQHEVLAGADTVHNVRLMILVDFFPHILTAIIW